MSNYSNERLLAMIDSVNQEALYKIMAESKMDGYTLLKADFSVIEKLLLSPSPVYRRLVIQCQSLKNALEAIDKDTLSASAVAEATSTVSTSIASTSTVSASTTPTLAAPTSNAISIATASNRVQTSSETSTTTLQSIDQNSENTTLNDRTAPKRKHPEPVNEKKAKKAKENHGPQLDNLFVFPFKYLHPLGKIVDLAKSQDPEHLAYFVDAVFIFMTKDLNILYPNRNSYTYAVNAITVQFPYLVADPDSNVKNQELLHGKIKNKFCIYRRQTPLAELGNPELVQNMRTKFSKKANKQTASTSGTQTSTTPSNPTTGAALV